MLTLFALVFALGCADISDIGDLSSESGEENRTEEKNTVELSAIQPEDVMIGFVASSAEDNCYTRLCESALREVADAIGVGEQNFKPMYNVASGYECTRVAQILISLGCNVIVSVGDELTDSMRKAAVNNPDVYFIASGTDEYFDNMSVYSIDTVGLQYFFGAVAATLSDTQRIGYIASLYKESVADINAFALGALSVSPELTVDVAFSDELGEEYADLVMKQFSVGGCDVFVRHGDGDALRKYIEDGSSAILDLCLCEHETAPIGATYNLGELYRPFFEMISSGEWTAASSRLSVSSGGIEADLLNGEFTDDDVQILSGVIDDLRSEDFNAFDGEIRNNYGEIEIKKGETPTDSEIEKMDFLVFGIVGTLPEKDYPRSVSYESTE